MNQLQRVKRAFGPLGSSLYLLLYRATKAKKFLMSAVRTSSSNLDALAMVVQSNRRDGAAFSQLAQAAKMVAMLEPQQANFIKANISRAEGQLLQDLVALIVSDQKRGGYFVEVGVGEGRRISNTYALERDFDWTGLLIEPNRTSHPSILEHRTATLCPEAAFNQDGLALNFDEHEDIEYSRLSTVGNSTAGGGRRTSYDVTTATLNTLLARHDAPADIDFMSIDTEGSEFEVLEGLDPAAWRIKLFTIEHNYDRARLAKIATWMSNAGYRRAFEHISEYDCIFIHASAWPSFLKD